MAWCKTIIISSGFVLLGCIEQEGQQTNKVNLDPSVQTDKSAFFNEPQFVALDTTGGLFIGAVGKIIVYKNNYFVLDRVGNKVVQYDSDGMGVAEFSNPGEGPGSINYVYDFSVNEHSEAVELMSPKGYVVAYDANTNRYREIISVANSLPAISYFHIIDQDLVVFYSKFSDYLLYVYSREKDEIVKRILPNANKEAVNIVHVDPFQKQDGVLKFMDFYEGKLYTITSDSATLIQSFYARGQPVSIDQFPADLNSPSLAMEYANKKDLVFPLVDYATTGDAQSVMVLQGGKEFRIFHCGSSDQSCYAVGNRFNVPIMPFLSITEDGKYIGVIPNFEYLDGMFPGFNAEGYQTGNPILFLYRPQT